MKKVTSFACSPETAKQLSLMVAMLEDANGYPSRSEVIRRAVRYFFEATKNTNQ